MIKKTKSWRELAKLFNYGKTQTQNILANQDWMGRKTEAKLQRKEGGNQTRNTN